LNNQAIKCADYIFQVPSIAQFTKFQSSEAPSSRQHPCVSNNSSIEVPNICTISSNSETYSAISSQQDCSCEDHDEDDDGDDDDIIDAGTFPIHKTSYASLHNCIGAY
jgi:hypothetical protein